VRADHPILYTIGHSNHDQEHFCTLLQQHRIDVLADVRSQPYSRYTPHFNAEERKAALATHGIRYVFLGDQLGGRPRDPQHYDEQGRALYWAHRPRIRLQTTGDRLRIRFDFSEPTRRYSVPVTDIRLYREDHVTPDAAAVERWQGDLNDCERVLVSVGLSRADKSCDETPAIHWLQVNNLHLPTGCH